MQHAAVASGTAVRLLLDNSRSLNFTPGQLEFQAFFMLQHLNCLQWACATGCKPPSLNTETSQGNTEGTCMKDAHS